MCAKETGSDMNQPSVFLTIAQNKHQIIIDIFSIIPTKKMPLQDINTGSKTDCLPKKNRVGNIETEEIAITLWMTCKLDTMFSYSAMDRCTVRK